MHPGIDVSDAEITAGVVCLMCGVAGSGKTTVAQQLEARGMVRLSVDEEIWSRFGRYGLDYPPSATPSTRSPRRRSSTSGCAHS